MDDKTVNMRRSVAMKAAANLAASVEPHTLDNKVRVYDWLYTGFCRELGVEASKNIVEQTLGDKPEVGE